MPEETHECCDTCKYKLHLVRFDYSHGGCEHTDMDGYVCMAFASEGEAVWMIGNCPSIGQCEMWTPKGDK